MLQYHSLNRIILSIVLDALSTIAALLIAAWLRVTLPYGQEIGLPFLPLSLFPLVVVIWIAVFFVLSVYDPRRSYFASDELHTIVTASFFALLVLAGALFFSLREISRLFIVYFFAANLTILVGWRVTLRFFARTLKVRRTQKPRRVLIVGSGALAQQVAARIERFHWTGLELVGFADDTNADGVIGTIGDSVRLVEQLNVEEVVLVLPYESYDRVQTVALDLLRLPIQVRIVPDFLSLALYRATVEDFSGLTLVNLRAPALNGYQYLVKRIFDLIVGGLLFALTLPLMIVAALLVRLGSDGPVIYQQPRVGENGRLFTMYKFRTMIVGADQLDDPEQIIQKSPRDPRVTRAGRWLRATSIDELPQLVNVLKGEMSLVGPRPELPWLVERYEAWQRQRFAVPQGMTGWWQVNGRSQHDMYLHTEDDLYYIQNYSLGLDIQILWKTIFAVIRRTGAY